MFDFISRQHMKRIPIIGRGIARRSDGLLHLGFFGVRLLVAVESRG